ncbi:VWA domain-containing protein [Chloroflexi bacterium TSY]|nr:VWA domain-containing protein [Chloroflexi bacterium TSY]
MNDNQLTPPIRTPSQERERRWRLILGKNSSQQEGCDGVDSEDGGENHSAENEGDENQASEQTGLSEEDQAIDETLDALYGDGDEGGFGGSNPDIARWLGNIHTYFPTSVAEMLQQDVLKRVSLRKLIQDPELVETIEPNLELVTQLVPLSRMLPTKTRETAREVVRKVVKELIEQLEYPLRQAISGSLNRALHTRNPRRQREINWLRTIHANLKHYQPSRQTVIPETLIGHGRQNSSLRDVILCIDQSGSMARSVVYASLFGAVMASVPALETRLVVFDTAVVDLTEQLNDPVDLIFGLQLRGGTNINRALTYCRQLVTRPEETILVLISDLFEGGNKENMLRSTAALVDDGVQIIVLIALDDKGAPRFNRKIAQDLVEIGVPSFACTPDLFPDLMGAAINGQNISQWAASQGIVVAPSN